MSGLFSSRAWEKIWLYRTTFLLGLSNTLKTAAVSLLIALSLGIVFGLMGSSKKKDTGLFQQSLCGSDPKYPGTATDVFFVLCAGVLRA